MNGILAELETFAQCCPQGAPGLCGCMVAWLWSHVQHVAEGVLYYEIRGKESFSDMASVIQEAFERVGGWQELPEGAFHKKVPKKRVACISEMSLSDKKYLW